MSLIQVYDKQSTWTHYHHITHTGIHFIPSKNQINVTLKIFFSDDISLRNIDTRPLLLFRQIKMAPQFLFNVK